MCNSLKAWPRANNLQNWQKLLLPEHLKRASCENCLNNILLSGNMITFTLALDGSVGDDHGTFGCQVEVSGETQGHNLIVWTVPWLFPSQVLQMSVDSIVHANLSGSFCCESGHGHHP
jgi:hypothetical protein